MCGIVGIFNLSSDRPIESMELQKMLAMIRHRGPDAFGIYRNGQIGLGNARLSILDLTGGLQPIHNEDESVWIVFNGEIFNYIELRADLEKNGHHFYTRSDTEVIVHLYEQYGTACLEYLNGQFAFAIWDRSRRSLFLARDRLGIRPLFYTVARGALLFASEIKALLAYPEIQAEIDPFVLSQVLTLWTPLPGRTIFCDIHALPPGHFMFAGKGEITIRKYWELNFPVTGEGTERSEETYRRELRELLVDATRLRLRADVPVGAYLSGGLDSSATAALVRHYTGSELCTFSIAFAERAFDERQYQEEASAFLRTDHRRLECHNRDIADVFPDVVWHTEVPILRTSPAPMYLLSRLVQESGIKVVVTGEGADEILGGYDIYKEDKVRRFWAREPDSPWRPLLLQRLYPYVQGLDVGSGTYLKAFFGHGLTDVDRPTYSHLLRWRNGLRLRRYLSPEVRTALGDYDPAVEFEAGLDGDFRHWSPLSRAQYIEMTLFMSEYLLSSQGDRMTAAHSVEGRYPFLDHRVVEFSACLPAKYKLLGLQEKYLLKRAVVDLLPATITRRPKRPYRAPIAGSFLGEGRPEYVAQLLSPSEIEEAGYFDPAAVSMIWRKHQRGLPLSEGDEMALVGVLSTQLLHRLFIQEFTPRPVEELGQVEEFVGEQ